jgi:hypothetical protein
MDVVVEERCSTLASGTDARRPRRTPEDDPMRASATAQDRIRDLELRHSTLDRELQVLTRRAHLTPDEEDLARRLKKEKLSAKDALSQLKPL